MKKTERSVFDGERLSNEQLGRLTRRFRDIERRVSVASERFDWLMIEMQKVADGIGGKAENNSVVSYADARRIMGKDILGIEEIEKVFSHKLEEKDLPQIKCSKTQLKRFKRFGFQLILEIEKVGSGHPITIRLLNALADGKTSDGGKFLYSSDGKNIKDDAWYKKEALIDNSLELGWRVSFKTVVEGTLGKNYLDQTSILLDLLENVFDGKIPEAYRESIKFFNIKKDDIANHIRNGEWKVAGDVIEACAIDKVIRESITSLTYRMYLTERAIGEKLFPTTDAWTSTRASGGRFVRGGNLGFGGAFGRAYGPDGAWDDVGASLSLKL